MPHDKCPKTKQAPPSNLAEIADYGKIVREMIFHEGELMNHRFQWFALLNGLLFGAFGLLWEFFATSQAIIVVVAVLGILISVSCWTAAYLGDRACRRLEASFASQLPDDFCPKCIERHIPPIIGLSDSTPLRFLLPWRLLFVFFMAAWGYISYIAITKTSTEPKPALTQQAVQPAQPTPP